MGDVKLYAGRVRIAGEAYVSIEAESPEDAHVKFIQGFYDLDEVDWYYDEVSTADLWEECS